MKKKSIFIIIGIGLALYVAGRIYFDTDDTEPRSSGAPTTAAIQSTSTPTPDVPSEYSNALKRAQSYSKTSHMSKRGIFDQLTSFAEGFEEDAVNYAMEHLDADYNYNALKSAESYNKTMHMSKAELFDQLTSEYADKFTAEEAQYAVDNLEADYKENALKSAKSYSEKMNMSKDAIFKQLTSEYGNKFTEEEAQYAIDNLD